MRKILLVEDDAALAETVSAGLQSDGFRVTVEADGAGGLRRARTERFDLVVLDVALPEMSGLEVCRGLREAGNRVPVIFLTGEKREEIDRVLGLELGADDYVLKPFGLRELVARVHAVLRRARPEPADIEECSFGDVHIDFRTRVASRGGRDLPLTAKEFGLLKILIRHEGQVVGRDRILNEVWGYDHFPTTRTIDTFMHGLRRKIEPDPSHPRHLLTIPWSGYKFVR